MTTDTTTGQPSSSTTATTIDLYKMGIIWPVALVSWQSIHLVNHTVASCVVNANPSPSPDPSAVITPSPGSSACGGYGVPYTNVTYEEQTVVLHVYIAEALGKVRTTLHLLLLY